MCRFLPPLAAVGLALLAGAPSWGQAPAKQARIKFEARAFPDDPFSAFNGVTPPPGPVQVVRGEVFRLVITGTPLNGFYTYPLTAKAPEQPDVQLTRLKWEGAGLVPLSPVRESPWQWKDPGAGIPPMLVHNDPFTLTQDVYVKPDAAVGAKLTLTGKLTVQVCKASCFIEEHVVTVNLEVAETPAEALTADLEKRLKETPPAPREVPVPADLGAGAPRLAGPGPGAPDGPGPGPASRGPAGPAVVKPPVSLIGAVLAALAGGFISLMTPCVFPMIPITVSYFLKQSEAKKGSAVLMALVYSGTIVLVLTLGGLVLLETLYRISTHPVTNFAIGAVFLVFALSLLGMYDLTLPSWLQDATYARQGQGGLLGVFFMGLTFSIISFTCVGPIYGGFIAFKAGNAEGTTLLHRVLPVLAYSTAFASPFFALALFPGLLRTMPKAGSWMNSVKVVMGFLELAAVVKFVRAGELTWTGKADFLSYDIALGLYVAICLVTALYLFGMYRLPHDHDAPETIGVPSLMTGLAFLTLGLYLAPGLFKTDSGESQQPGGKIYAWVDSFLLPDPPAKGPVAPARGGAPVQKWQTNLDEALALAKKDKKLVFLDFTGIACTNCKLNERSVFPRADVQEAFGQHVLLKLYTDTVPAGVAQEPDAAGSITLRNEKFQTAALPVYALLRPTDESFEVVRVYGTGDDDNGLITDVADFVKFLTK